MVKITIGNKEIIADAGRRLLAVALENGIDIPNLCYHERISPTGACRLCIVKIEGRSGFFTSCTTEVEDGMRAIVFDRELESAREYIVRCLISEHNFSDDLSYRDELVDLSKKFGLSDYYSGRTSHFWKDLEYPVDDTSPVLTYDGSKCIKCFRCIKACDEIQGKNVLSFAKRGLEKYIVAGYASWGESECDGCGECIQLCPTTAILEKPNIDLLRVESLDDVVSSTCPYCGVGCRIKIEVKNNRIIRINGMEKVKPNDGRLCVKGRFGYGFVNHKERLSVPLVKVNGSFKEVGWDEVYDLIAFKFNDIKRNFGANALAGYASAKCTNEDNYVFQKFIRTAFGTNNIDYCTRLCHASTVFAMIESIGSGAGSNSIEDYANADCIVIIGNNMVETHPVTATFVKNGVSNGAKLIIIDPKWTPLAKLADVWLQPKLGTDIALINGLIYQMIDNGFIDVGFISRRIRGGFSSFLNFKKSVTDYNPLKVKRISGVEPDMLIKAAKLYGASDKVMIATGMGVSQQLNGTDTVSSILNLCLITGKIGRPGCGLNPPRGQNNVQGASDVGCLPITYPGYIPVTDALNRQKLANLWGVPRESMPSEIGLTTVEIIKAVHDGEIKGMYIMGENPMLSDPNLNFTEEALNKLDFLLVQDIFLTETAQFADVVLPGVSFAEKNGTFISSDRRVNRVRQATRPPGKARQDWVIISEISEKMGCHVGNYLDESSIFDELALATPILSGLSYSRIEEEGIQWPCISKADLGSSTLFVDTFNTYDGLALLKPIRYEVPNENADSSYPFLLNSGRILYQYHTGTMSRRSSSLTKYANQSFVLMNPYDSDNLGFLEGQIVRLISKQGELETVLKISEKVAIGELFMPFHYAESRVNNLTRDEIDPHSKIPAFKRTACRVEKK